MARRVLVATIVVAAALVPLTVAGAPAGAGGGSRLVADREFYRPGEAVHLTALVQKLNLDWLGPYDAYLRPLDPDVDSAGGPGSDPRDVPIGRLVVTRLDPTTVRAEVTFVLPKLPDGEWVVLYCNRGCTAMLGDLVGGHLRVGPPPPPFATIPTTIPPTVAPATTARPPTTRAATPTTARPATDEAAEPASTTVDAALVAEDDQGVGETGGWLVVVAALALLAAAGAIARRRGSRRQVTVSSSAGPSDRTVDVDGAVEVELEPAPPAGDEPIGAGR